MIDFGVTAFSDPRERLELLHELGSAFAAHLDLDVLIPLVMARCQATFDAEGASILLLDTERGELYFPYVATTDPAVAERLAGLRFPSTRGIAGEALTIGRALRVDDATGDVHFYDAIDRETGVHTRALIAAPLAARQGPLGVLQVINPRHGGAFTDDDLAFVEVLAGSVATAIENARLYTQLKASAEGLRAQVSVLRRDLARRDGFTEILGTGTAMRDVFRLMESAAASPMAVLIEGETGTGKELVARGIHRASPRGAAPFVAINCAALPESLLESELFGHRRGAFTGALQDQPGLFESASGGTIFLDEIGEMPIAMQAKLLRVLQEGEVTRIGDLRPRKIDVRLISATNRELAAEIVARRFRDDLYYRIGGFPIRVPALRERRFDVPLLADHFLRQAAERHGKRIPGIAPETMTALQEAPWPGNVRQLQNEVTRAVALAADGETIGRAHLSPAIVAGIPDEEMVGEPAGDDDLRLARAAFEARHIARVLKAQQGNVTRAARALGLSRTMLQQKMKEYDLR